MTAKCVLYQADGHSAVLMYHIGRQVQGAFINNSSRPVELRDRVRNVRRGLRKIFHQVAGISHKDHQAFGFIPFFKVKNTLNGCFVRCIAANTPDRVRRIQDEAAGPQYSKALDDIVLKIIHMIPS
jgi:hypothetical protein